MYRSLEIGGKHGEGGRTLRRSVVGECVWVLVGKREIIEMPVLEEDIGGTE